MIGQGTQDLANGEKVAARCADALAMDANTVLVSDIKEKAEALDLSVGVLHLGKQSSD